MYKEFLLKVAKAWASDKMEAVERESGTDSACPGPSTQTPRRPHGDSPGRLLGDMQKHVLQKIVKSEDSKKYPTRTCHVCTDHIKGAKLDTFVSSV
jgi:hypothetical protein